MGAAKEAMMHAQYQHEVATDIAVRSGVLERCAYHGTVSDTLSGDNGPAYALANHLFNQGQVGDAFSTREELNDAIKAAIDDAGMECGACEKLFAD